MRDLSPLSSFRQLRTLTLKGNPLCDPQGLYRAKVAALLPQLTVIDSERLASEAPKLSAIPLHLQKDDDDDNFVLPASVPWTKGFSWDVGALDPGASGTKNHIILLTFHICCSCHRVALFCCLFRVL